MCFTGARFPDRMSKAFSSTSVGRISFPPICSPRKLTHEGIRIEAFREDEKNQRKIPQYAKSSSCTVHNDVIRLFVQSNAMEVGNLKGRYA